VGAFENAHVESLQTFTQIYNVKGLEDLRPDRETKLHFATIQGMVKRVLFAGDESARSNVDDYDCIVIDECHRGYTLDREMSDSELSFRDQDDYRSKYRAVLDYFDAVKIGLTATPALHTTEIFGDPVFQYSYREAVIDGWLVDHEPPIRIKTELSTGGIKWKAGEQVSVYNGQTQQLDLVHLDDELAFDVEDFNLRVVTESFNRVVCEYLATQFDTMSEGKTLVFCATDAHADLVVDLLKKALHERYGAVDDDAVDKITGSADKPRARVRRFKNERLPNIAVTVDLLTTGVDVPEIVNLVFLRRVKSRILYEQMLGRGTRLCPEIGKEFFRIYDAVDLYAALEPFTSMKPVAANPTFTFAQLLDEVLTVKDEAAKQLALDQLVAKLQRKKRRLGEAAQDQIETATGVSVAGLVDLLRHRALADVVSWLGAHRAVADVLDRVAGAAQYTYVSEHADAFREVEHGYGPGRTRPEDYLDGFSTFIRENMNTLPALMVVTQRPRELTRKQLRELELALSQAGYTELGLQTAWREMTNQDITASIIGFIRQRALGEPLVPYADRVGRAVKAILASRAWTTNQRQWLERIAKQLRTETVVDRDALDRGQFEAKGGFSFLNKVFEGRLEQVLGDINDALWKEVG
jgi:type I restriction enzyme, R subunit